ncbi:MAG: PDZ domain-containing protein [Ignavibacteria bacterium]|nr:PDZ domain-containing protein [Ignavibacteria bacterium]
MAYSIEQTDKELLNSTSNVTYTLNFSRATQHLVKVTINVKNVIGSKAIFVMPSWTPGSYKIRDFAGFQGNVAAFIIKNGGRNQTSYKWINKASFSVNCENESEIEVEYLVYCHERSVRTNHVNRFHAFLTPAAVCMYVVGRTDEVHHVVVERNEIEWPNISTQLSPVTTVGNSVVLGALNYDILVDSPIEIGNHVVMHFDAAGAKHEVAIASTHKVDAEWLTAQIQHIVETEAKLFGGVPYDRYIFIIQVYVGVRGGLEHTRSSVNATDPSHLHDKTKAAEFLSLLCHEYFHLWNVKRIRPIELGPFDYTTENYTSMLWLAEGLTSYYDDLWTLRCGYYTEKQYIDLLAKDHINKLSDVVGRNVMSIKDSSYLAWLKLYMPNADASNRFPSYYLKGGVLFLLLDLYIVDHTDGKYSLDDGLKILWKRYQENPSKGLTQDECIALLEVGTQVQLRELMVSWLDGTQELPYKENLATVGLDLYLKPNTAEAITLGENRSLGVAVAKIQSGMNYKETSGKVIVTSVQDGMPAQLAGIGVDDEIIAVNGKRVSTVSDMDVFLAEAGLKETNITAHCDGQIYETTIVCLPETVYGLRDVKSISDRQKKMRSVWLRK